MRDLAITCGNQDIRQPRQWNFISIVRNARLAKEALLFHVPLNASYWCQQVDSTGCLNIQVDRLCFSQRVNVFGLHTILRAIIDSGLRISSQLSHSVAFSVEGRSISTQDAFSLQVIPFNRVNMLLTMLRVIMNRAIEAPALLHSQEIGDIPEENKSLVIFFKLGVNNPSLIMLREIMSRDCKTPSLLLNQNSCVISGQSMPSILSLNGRVDNLGLATLLQQIMTRASRASALLIRSQESRACPGRNISTIMSFNQRLNFPDREIVRRASRAPTLLLNEKRHASPGEHISTVLNRIVDAIDSITTLREMMNSGSTASCLVSRKSLALYGIELASSIYFSPRMYVDGLRTILQEISGPLGTPSLQLSQQYRAVSEQDTSAIVSLNTSVNCIGFLTMLRENRNRYLRAPVLPLNQEKRTPGWSPVCGATRHCCSVSLSSNGSGERQQHVECNVSNNTVVAHGLSGRQDENPPQLKYMTGAGTQLVCGLQDSQISRRTESVAERLACVVTLLTREYQRIIVNRNVSRILHCVMSDNDKSETDSHKDVIKDADSKMALIDKGPINAHDIQSGQDDNGKLNRQIKSGIKDNPHDLAPLNNSVANNNGVMNGTGEAKERIVEHWCSNLSKTLPGLSGAFLKSGLQEHQRGDQNNKNKYGHSITTGLYNALGNANNRIKGHVRYNSDAHMSHVSYDAKGYVNHLGNGDNKSQVNFDSEEESEDYSSVYSSESENDSMYDIEFDCDFIYESESDCDFMYESESENGSVYDSDCESDLEQVEGDDDYRLELVQQDEQDNVPNGNNNMVENPAPVVPLLAAIPQQVQEQAVQNEPVIPQGNQPGLQHDAPDAHLVNAAPNVAHNPQVLQPNPGPQDEAPAGEGVQQLPHAPGHGPMMQWFLDNGYNPHVAPGGPHGNHANQGPQDEAPMGAHPHHFPIHHAQDQIVALNGNGEVPGVIPANGIGIPANEVGIDEAPPFGVVVPAPQVPQDLHHLQQGQDPHHGQNPQQGQDHQQGQQQEPGQHHQHGQHPQQGNPPQQNPHPTGPLSRIVAAARYVKRKLSRHHNAVPMYVPGAPREERPPIGLDEAPPLIGVPMVPHPGMDEGEQPRGLCACFAFLFRHQGNPVQEYPLHNEQMEEFEEQIAIAGQDIDGFELEDDEEDMEDFEQPVEAPEEQMEAVALPVEVF